MFVCLDEWPAVAATNNIAGLAQHLRTTHIARHGCRLRLDGFSVCLQRVSGLDENRTARTRKILEMKKFQICARRHISLTPYLKSMVVFGSSSSVEYEALARALGCPLGLDGTALGRNVGPTLFSLQKKYRCRRPTLVPRSTGEGNTWTLQFRSTLNTPYGFVESTFPQQFKSGDAHIFVDGQ